MTLEQNIKAILECNFSIAKDEVIEAATKRIMEQIKRQVPVEYELEGIKSAILDYCDRKYWDGVQMAKELSAVIDKHFEDKKEEGETDGERD